MKTVECGCGRHVRPCNFARHMRARHTPSIEEAEFGAVVQPPSNPIRSGRGKDRRYDEVFPRGEGSHRYRVYRLRAGDLEIVGTCPDSEAMGKALAYFYSEGEFVDDDSVGVLDTATEPGHWLVNPFTLGRKAND